MDSFKRKPMIFIKNVESLFLDQIQILDQVLVTQVQVLDQVPVLDQVGQAAGRQGVGGSK